MKPIMVLTICAMLLCLAVPAGATLLADMFGVTLSVDGAGTFVNGWEPTSKTADYLIDDNWSSYFGRAPHGGEAFDIEAIYFDDDATNAYVAVVGSFPVPHGLPFFGSTVEAGDLRLNLGRTPFDLGIDIDGGTGQVASTLKTDWYQSSSAFVGEKGPTNFAGGIPLGFASLACYDYGLVERGYNTYVFELTVNRALLGGPAAGAYIGFEWTMGCRNDVIQLDGDFDTDTPPVPEPGTLILLSTGLLGAAGLVRRRRK